MSDETAVRHPGFCEPVTQRGLDRNYHRRNEFRNLLADCGFSQADLARKIDVHPNTVSGWACGAKMPGPVRAYMKLYAAVKSAIGEVD